MNDKYSNRQNMHRTVLATLDDPAFKAVYENHPPAVFTAKAGEFRTLVASLEELMREQNAAIAGAAERKEREEAELEDKAHEIGQALAAWFGDVRREDAAAEVDFSRSDWQGLRDEALLQRSRLVLSRLQRALETHADDLARYGLDAGDAAGLQKEIEDYAAVVSAPSNAIANRKALTQALRPRFQEAGELLRSMDKLVLRFRSTDPGRAFADAWLAARTIRDLGRRAAGADEPEQAPAAIPAPAPAT